MKIASSGILRYVKKLVFDWDLRLDWICCSLKATDENEMWEDNPALNFYDNFYELMFYNHLDFLRMQNEN